MNIVRRSVVIETNVLKVVFKYHKPWLYLSPHITARKFDPQHQQDKAVRFCKHVAESHYSFSTLKLAQLLFLSQTYPYPYSVVLSTRACSCTMSSLEVLLALFLTESSLIFQTPAQHARPPQQHISLLPQFRFRHWPMHHRQVFPLIRSCQL